MSESFWAVIPFSVLIDKNLSSTEKLLYAEISSLSNNEGYCYASNRYIADMFDVTERTIQRGLKNLKKQGYIDINLNNEGKQTDRKIYLSFSTVEPTTKMSPPPMTKMSPKSIRIRI